MVNSIAFPTINNRVEKLLKITNTYRFYDLVRAVYCFNLCINNRGLLESCLALNGAVLEHNGEGKKTIQTYGEFTEFINSLEQILGPQPMDDAVVEDFGEVKLSFENKYYNVILGTGHNSVFGCYHFISSAVRLLDKKNEYRELLEYHSDMMDFFKDVNCADGNYGVRFTVPSEELFNKVGLYFEKQILDYDLNAISGSLEISSAPIEKVHFWKDDDNILPLYNTSILVDYYEILYSRLTEEQRITVANMGISQRAMSLFDADRNPRCTLYLPAIIFKDQKPLNQKKSFPFILFGRKGLIISINVDEYTNSELEERIHTIEDLHSAGKLQFGECVDRFKTGNLRGASVDDRIEIQFLLFNSFTNINSSTVLTRGKEKRNIVTALDIIYYLDFMDDPDELFDYLKYTGENEYERMFAFGTDAPRFLVWKQQEHLIAKGAVEYGMVDLGYDEENAFVVDYYKNNLNDYPFHLNDYLFSDPFTWKINYAGSKMKEFVGKYGTGFGGKYKLFNNGAYIMLAHNVVFYDEQAMSENHQMIYLLDELMEEMILTCEGFLASKQCLANTGIQIMYMPEKYARTAGHEVFLDDTQRQYVYSDAMFYRGKWIIRYVVKDFQKLFNDISQASDRRVEVEVFKEVFASVQNRYRGFYQDLTNYLEPIKCQKKHVDMTMMEIDYYWNSRSAVYQIHNEAFHIVRKRIAAICNQKDIASGEYFGDKATQVIRAMQKEITADFEELVSMYDMENLHCRVMDIYASLQHEINVDWKRFDSYHELDEQKVEEVSHNIITQRETAKKSARVCLYLMETNLFLSRINGTLATEEELEVLLAYSNWMVVLSDTADMCHFTESEAHIEITPEFLIEAEENEGQSEKFRGSGERVYRHSFGLKRDQKIDKSYMEAACTAFKQDTGIEISRLLDLLTYLRNNFNEEYVTNEGANVLSVHIEDLTRDFRDEMTVPVTMQEIKALLQFITIDPSTLKTVKGVTDYYLPIGKRSERNNRLEVKPLVMFGDRYIFSPIIAWLLDSTWISGMAEFILPYEVGMNATVTVIKKWKHEYEKKIVDSLMDEFVKNGFDPVKRSLQTRKIKNIIDQPATNIGDYDVLAINQVRKEIWIVECKVIEKVATFYDMYHQQNNFFNNHRFAEKFQTRIDFMNAHKKEVLEWLKIPATDDYTVVPYMCMNKVLVPRYNKVDFPIVTFSEICELIANRNL